MSKKHNKPQPETTRPGTGAAAADIQPEAAPGRPSPQAPLQPAPGSPPVSRATLWTFWGGVAAVLVVARALDYLLPGIPERVIERWVMLAFAAFLGAFLFKLK
ncbi:MAG TPA: hypothetical protein DCS63_01600 [Elusimicrobia bacterium]|nr:hypothetical protein [Elusimicrobiota bacterium]